MRHFLKGALVALFFAPGTAVIAATVVTLAPATGHPNLPVTVSGSGFAAGEAVDIYIDTVDSLLAVSSGTGTIKAAITMPASAQPGLHYVTAVGRKSGDAAQKAFTVSTSWVEDGFGAAHLAWNQYENTLSPSVVPSLEQQWSVPESLDYGAPAVVGGRMYFGSSKSGGGIYALNATTGALVWHKNTAVADQFAESAAVAGGVIYIEGSSGLLYAFNSSGTQLWSTQLATPAYSAPVVVGGVIYIGSGSSIYALNTSGSILWSTATSATIFANSLAVVNGRVFATSSDEKIYALNASTGGVLWSFTTSATVSGTPAVANGIVYVGSDDKNVYALRAATGTLVWTVGTGGPVVASPAVAGGVVYIASTDGTLYALGAVDGHTVWLTPVSAEGQVSIADGVVYVGDINGTVSAFGAQYGESLVAVATGAAVYSSPVVVNGMLYVSSNDGSLYAYAPGGAGADGLRRSSTPPALSSLHPDMQLVPVR